MYKRITTFLLTLSLLIGCLCGAQARSLSRAEVYEALQQELHRYLDGDDAMPPEELTAGFQSLGAYKKSAAFSYYTAILRDTETDIFEQLELYTSLMRLDEDFCALLTEAEFPSVDELEAYALGRQAEAAGDWPSAVTYYEQSIAVLDSMLRLAQLRMAGAAAAPTPAASASGESAAELTLSVKYSKYSGIVTLKWSEAPGAATYRVLRATGRGEGMKQLKPITTTPALNHTDDSCYRGFYYSYQVEALNAQGKVCGQSPILSIYTATDPTATPKPTVSQPTAAPTPRPTVSQPTAEPTVTAGTVFIPEEEDSGSGSNVFVPEEDDLPELVVSPNPTSSVFVPEEDSGSGSNVFIPE